MSIVCCKVTDTEIQLASDSIMVRGYTQEKGKDDFAKMFKTNGMIIGGTGYSEEISLFQMYCQTRKPAAPTNYDILLFLSEFCSWKKTKIEIYQIKNSYIILFDGHAFYINNFFVKEIVSYEAIGAGMDFALSALYLGKDVYEAAETACELSVFCEKPIIVFKMSK